MHAISTELICLDPLKQTNLWDLIQPLIASHANTAGAYVSFY